MDGACGWACHFGHPGNFVENIIRRIHRRTVDDGYGIGVYAGSSVSRLLTIAQGESGVSFYAAAGFEYAIAVDDFSGFRTDFGLVLNGPPTPPVLDPSSARRLSDGSFGLLIAGTNAQTFAIQASTNLVDWTTVLIDTLLGNSQDFVDSEAGSLPWRFYRVVPLEAVLGSPRLHVGPGQFDGSGAFSVRVIGSGGQPFTFQASTNLVNWTDLTRDILIGDFLDFRDTQAASLHERFYRALPLH